MDEAWDWRGKARGGARAEAGLCLGMAYAAQERYGEAHAAFLSGLGAADAQDVELRARLAALAGNAALAGGDHQAALDVLGSAETLASAAGSTLLSGGIAIDKARALVALRRLPEAATALATARKADPANAQAWLLSATLSRRLGNLDEAQERIERAGELAPGDPEVGLEAGVIAVLAGRDDAARLSWQSVIDTAPQSAFANQAKEYIAQLQSYDNGSE
jgi:tetratricopeptide (TPR) repeat protein